MAMRLIPECYATSLKKKRNRNERYFRFNNVNICNTCVNSIVDYMADERNYKKMNDRFLFNAVVSSYYDIDTPEHYEEFEPKIYLENVDLFSGEIGIDYDRLLEAVQNQLKLKKPEISQIMQYFEDNSNSSSEEYVTIKPDKVLQSTGLKDKNGKLIFEEDIVKKEVFIDYQGNQFQPDVYMDRTYIGIVHFSASNGATLQKLKIYETENPYEPKKLRDKRETPKATKLVACRSEVIGNIYETPELLESEVADV